MHNSLTAPQNQYTLFPTILQVSEWGSLSMFAVERYARTKSLHSAFLLQILEKDGNPMKTKKVNSDQAFVSALRMKRMHEGLRQIDVARQCKLTPSEISRFDRGIFNIKLEKAQRVAEFCHMQLNDLVHHNYDAVIATFKGPPKVNEALSKHFREKRELRDRVGKDGEKLVAEQEREKLAGTPYANAVNPYFANDPSAGFDILSVTPDGELLYIEVKTTTQHDEDGFYMTAGERAFMETCFKEGKRYELRRVCNIDSLKKRRVITYTPQDLMAMTFEPVEYRVTGGGVA